MICDNTTHDIKSLRDDADKLSRVPLCLISDSFSVEKIQSMISLAKDLEDTKLLEQISSSLGRNALSSHTINVKFPGLVESYRHTKTANGLAKLLSEYLPDLHEYLCSTSCEYREKETNKVHKKIELTKYMLKRALNNTSINDPKKLQARLTGQERELTSVTRKTYREHDSQSYTSEISEEHEISWIKHNKRDDIDKDSMIAISHGGGRYAIMSFLTGDWAGYTLEKDDKLGLQIHPCFNECRDVYVSRENDYSRQAPYYLDRPARLTAEVPAGFVLFANNEYEGAITLECIPYMKNIKLVYLDEPMEVICLPDGMGSTTTPSKDNFISQEKPEANLMLAREHQPCTAARSETMFYNAPSLFFNFCGKLDEPSDLAKSDIGAQNWIKK